MSDILEELTAMRRRDAELREAEVSFDEMMRRASAAPAPCDFIGAFRGEGRTPRVISELKRASPSEGMIREDFRPPELAQELESAGAAGADAVLLIAAVLDDAKLSDLLAFAHELGLAALVETHDESEIDRAVGVGAKMIGVNCRNLRNFKCDVSRLETFIGRIPRPCVRIAESGMHSAEAIARARDAGADGFLVGTALMRERWPGQKLKELLTTSH